MPPASRRALLASLLAPALGSCRASLPALTSPVTTPGAQALLADAAAAHGVGALAGMSDVNISYAGEWPSLVNRLQPELVDAGFRGGSQERLLLREDADAAVAAARAGTLAGLP